MAHSKFRPKFTKAEGTQKNKKQFPCPPEGSVLVFKSYFAQNGKKEIWSADVYQADC